MKLYLKNISLAILMACFAMSCDLDTHPSNALDAKIVFRTTQNCESVFRGTWNYLFNDGGSLQSVGMGMQLLNDDFGGSDIVRTLSYGYSHSYQLTNGYSRGEHNSALWRIVYDAINNCNNIIKYVDDADGTDAAKKLIKGKTYATRGYLYMYLASHYSFAIDVDPNAVCVPIYTEPTDYEMATTGKPAASVSEVYQQALDDLEMGLSFMTEDFSHGKVMIQQYVPDYLVTLGLLARTNLYARHWQEAYDYAVRALAKNSYLMNEDEYNGGFSDFNNKEWMWSFAATIDSRAPCDVFYFKDTTTPGSYYTSMNTDPYFKDMFVDGDYRKDMSYWGYTSYNTVALLNTKFRFKDINNGLGDIVLMRTSEMYLIKAEAAAHITGKEAEAQQTLLTLRQARMKAGETAEVTETGDDLLKAIWLERRKELWGEGFSLTDIIRNQQSVERREFKGTVEINGNPVAAEGHPRRVDPKGNPFVKNSIYYLFRIPETEELQNKNLYLEHPRLAAYDL